MKPYSKPGISEACCEANVAAGLSSRSSIVWQPCPSDGPGGTAMGPGGPHDSVKVEQVSSHLLWFMVRTWIITTEHPSLKELALSLPGGNLLERLYPSREWTVVISRSHVQEATRTRWILCEWELLVGLSALPRSGGTCGEAPGPRTKQEEVKRVPKILMGKFKVWPKQPTLVNRGRCGLQQCREYHCMALALAQLLISHCFLLTVHTGSPHLPPTSLLYLQLLRSELTFSCEGARGQAYN